MAEVCSPLLPSLPTAAWVLLSPWSSTEHILMSSFTGEEMRPREMKRLAQSHTARANTQDLPMIFLVLAFQDLLTSQAVPLVFFYVLCVCHSVIQMFTEHLLCIGYRVGPQDYQVAVLGVSESKSRHCSHRAFSPVVELKNCICEEHHNGEISSLIRRAYTWHVSPLGLLEQNTQTEAFINNRNLFLTVSEAGESKIKTPTGLVCVEGPLLVHR